MDVDFVHKEGQKCKGGKETTRAKESPKARGKERASKMRKERVLGKATRIKKSSKIHVERQDTSGVNVGRKADGASKQANNVGETKEIGDVNWIMMV